MAGGSYLVARKIRMVIETWDRQQLGEQERIIGRDKGEGAPLSGGTEFTEPELPRARHRPAAPRSTRTRTCGSRIPTTNNGAQLLRRGYNFVDGNDELGRLNAGLFFIAFQRDPRKQFIPIQRSSRERPMNEYSARRLGDLRRAAGAQGRRRRGLFDYCSELDASGSAPSSPVFATAVALARHAELPVTVRGAGAPSPLKPASVAARSVRRAAP